MDDEQVKTGFGKVLNRHGYGFHYSVLRLAQDAAERGHSQWVFKAAEFPVQVQGTGTRIDFVLKLPEDVPIFLLAECKRANPALSNWCFARAPYVRRNRTREYLFAESIQRTTSGAKSVLAQGAELSNAYHVALEVRSNQRGDPCGSGRGTIEAAATQVCRGLNGMVQAVAGNPELLEGANVVYFLPVIFTTADVWSSDVNLAAANHLDGTVDLRGTRFSREEWVHYQYHLSPGIKHSVRTGRVSTSVEELLDWGYVRTIPIVSASGIEQFLYATSNPDLWLAG